MKSTLANVALFALCLMPASGATLISNLDVNGDTGALICESDGDTECASDLHSSAGMGFSVPTGSNYSLDMVSLSLEFSSMGASPVLQLFSDSGGLPGAAMRTFANPAFSLGSGVYDFLPGSAFTLQAGQTYWLVLNNAGSSTFVWDANLPYKAPAGILTHAGSVFGFGTTTPAALVGTNYGYALMGTELRRPDESAVPEPGAGLLLTSGLALLGIGRWKNRLAKRSEVDPMLD